MTHDHANASWRINALPNGCVAKEDAQLAVLMDIREELQDIRRLLNCHNVQAGFIAMQELNRHIRRRFPKKKRARRKAL